jgi:hypothetical protein
MESVQSKKDRGKKLDAGASRMLKDILEPLERAVQLKADSKKREHLLDPLEKHIEEHISEYAKKSGVLTYKFTSPGITGVPDRLFISPQGRTWYFEFKRQGRDPTTRQKREIDKMIKHKAPVFVVDNKLRGEKLIDWLKMT